MTDSLFDILEDAGRVFKTWQQHIPKSVHHSQTSQDAAISVLPRHRTLQEIVLEAITEAPEGLTDEQIVEVTGLAPNTARPRRIELANKDLIESDGTRKTKSGRQAQIWKVKI